MISCAQTVVLCMNGPIQWFHVVTQWLCVLMGGWEYLINMGPECRYILNGHVFWIVPPGKWNQSRRRKQLRGGTIRYNGRVNML